MDLLTITIGSVEFPTSVFVASGTFGYGREAADLVDLQKIGAIITKSVGLETRLGNPQPRIFETEAGMLNSIGLQNVGLKSFIADKLPFLRECNARLIVNVAGKTLDEFVEVIRVLEDQSDILGYELNFSCPNVKQGGLEFSQDAKVTHRAVSRARAVTERLLIPKLTPNVTRISEIALAAEEAGADAVSLINTVTGMAVDVDTWKPRINTIVGGYSGPAIKPIALAKVYETAQKVRIPIIGIGGIRTWRDAVEFFLTGATAVQIGTANFVDPRTAVQVAEGLTDYLKSRDLKSISELQGRLRGTIP